MGEREESRLKLVCVAHCLAICLTILLAASAWADEPSRGAASPSDGGAAPGARDSVARSVTDFESALVDAIAQGERSVVAIARVKRADHENLALEIRPDAVGRIGVGNVAQPGDPDFIPNEYGTGIVIDKHGLVVTHSQLLADECDYYVTTVERKTYRAQVKAADPRSELAVLSIDAHDLTPMQLGDATKLKKGQIVVALGNPYGIARDGQASASWGIIANLGRKAPPATESDGERLTKTTLPQLGTLIQTDAKLNLGTTGGALVNLRGELVGLTISIAAGPGYEQSAGYALPVDDTFRRAIEKLKEGREVEYGLLGIAPENLDMESLISGRRGARVDRIYAGTPAEAAGLAINDVITSVNGRPVFDADSLVLEVGKLPVESTVRLAVVRSPDKNEKMVDVRLAKYFVPGRKVVTEQAQAWRGLRVDFATAVKRFRDSASQDLAKCVVVSEVEPESPAAAAGLKPEMFVSHVAAAPVTTPQEFLDAVAGHAGPVELRIVMVDPQARFGPAPRRSETRTIEASASK